MDKDFMQYVYARIEKTLEDNTEYRELQSKCADASKSGDIKEYEVISCAIESKAEELCYIKGFRDAIALLTK